MSSGSHCPVKDQECIKLDHIGDHVSEDIVPEPVLFSPSKKMKGKLVVSGGRRLSTISDQQPDEPDIDRSSHDPLGGSECGGSSFSLSSDKWKNSSSCFSSEESSQPDAGDDCAAVLLACLYCHFHELMVMLPDTCERAVTRCFPSYKHIKECGEKDQPEKDCCNCNVELDWSLCNSCKDTAELLELAMEISEVCYR
ncbi:myoD family inhibitor domain-containing protein 2-like [Thalassophryne amazonica]|uniref:myoD family inhibitor domain-containing protein 2-like n=1 Tax=Thalassophryne amazonica TaxID=390379 RepID=UPI001470C156|nr:myoD family inhibitor domain-containing protein 2-like [Thalassophryne amazonica]